MTPTTLNRAPLIAWFHCFAGLSGDMALGSLLDAGADVDEVLSLLRRIPLDGWDLRTEGVLRGGMACTRAVVATTAGSGSTGDGGARSHARIAELVNLARLPERITARALSVFSELARAEGHVHRTDPRDVHFHEVGGHDAIIDVVGTAAALEVLGVDVVTASPVATGTGTVPSDHGILPNPSPAVVRLLRGVPVYGRSTAVELTTPTGAAILAALSDGFGPMPPLEITATGYGAGAAELDELPNCAQVVVGRSTGHAPSDDGQPLLVLETNVDDATGEQLAHAVTLLIEAGAYDAWVTPIVMKKGRPAHTLHALCDPVLAGPMREVIGLTTGTFGIRALAAGRWPVPRVVGDVEVDGHTVAMKASAVRAKAEFGDVAAVAARTGGALQEISSRAEEAWRHRVLGDAPDPSGAGAAVGDGKRTGPEP
ncbi:MAG: nickel pincer cofactor biosynthesis protein LarC [Acidimicrobiales bacterium]